MDDGGESPYTILLDGGQVELGVVSVRIESIVVSIGEWDVGDLSLLDFLVGVRNVKHAAVAGDGGGDGDSDAAAEGCETHG